MSKKTYVLDTNVLLSDPNSLFSFQENDLIIPLVVLEELDRHKSRQDEIGHNARRVSRTLDAMRGDGVSLTSGVKLPGGGTLCVLPIDKRAVEMPSELDGDKVDNLIIAFMLSVSPGDMTLVSKDINVRIKCDSLGVRCEDYLNMRVNSGPEQLCKGVDVVDVGDDVIDSFYTCSMLPIIGGELSGLKLFPNQPIILQSTTSSVVKSAMTRYNSVLGGLVPVNKVERAFGLKPRNKEQVFALDLLFDPEVKLLTMTGCSGGGKTLLAIAAALEQLRGVGDDRARYDKLLITRPVQPVGKEVGFLPGSLEEKMEPWIAPIKDNLNFLVSSRKPNTFVGKTEQRKPVRFDSSYLSLMQERGLIEIEAITFIRGRSIPNSFIVIDECQNLTIHELKTIVTRVGDGTKIVLTGDIEQIDNVHVDVYTNGLTYAIERFRGYPLAGHIALIKGERSDLATLASKIL